MLNTSTVTNYHSVFLVHSLTTMKYVQLLIVMKEGLMTCLGLKYNTC
jgi:hypothetical protein